MEQRRDFLKAAGWIIGVGIACTVLAPIIFTLPASTERWDFSTKGPVGDTIGGLTAPIINLMSALLLYLAFRAQVHANRDAQLENAAQAESDAMDRQTTVVEQLYITVRQAIDKFSYVSLDPDEFRNNGRVYGSEAIFTLWQEVYCHKCHLSEAELKANPKLTELFSVLELLRYALLKVEQSDIHNKDVMRELLRHQLIYKVYPKLKEIGDDAFKPHMCDECKEPHGLPDNIIDIVRDLIERTKAE